MELIFKKIYEKLTDKEIVMRIITKPYDEKAATYLLYDRYYPLFYTQCLLFVRNMDWFDDCLSELFLVIKGPKLDWHSLASFQWRSSLGGYLKRISMNYFVYYKKKMIDKHDVADSYDKKDLNKPAMEIANDDGETYENVEEKIMIMEAIGKLQDEDQRFIILKTLQGYKSKEIAIMLQKRWEKYGIVKKYAGETVVASDAYVNVERNRAYKKLKTLLQDFI